MALSRSAPPAPPKGSTVTITVKPDEGYVLDELVVTDKNGDTVKLTDKGNGKQYTFKMPASRWRLKFRSHLRLIPM
ncbi:MAG: InlB B-repeat-containing protein [Oscillospiraceae bacterium]